MSVIKFTRSIVQHLKDIVATADQATYIEELQRLDIPPEYATNMGRLALCVELEEIPDPDQVELEFKKVCRREDDKRCQVGHVISRLNSKQPPNYSAFLNNAYATVLIVDKTGLNLPHSPNGAKKLSFPSVECRNGLDLTFLEVDEGVKLCDSYFYANEPIPHTNILGSGYFLEHDKIVTAAHVLNRAYELGTRPENLIFIRAHHAFGQSTTIEVNWDRVYSFDQDNILENSQMIYGADTGDIAWVKVKPLYDLSGGNGKVYPRELNGVSHKVPQTNGHIYALGHGLGIPMKLSFGGTITGHYKDSIMSKCHLNILPGSSGSPVFDAQSHKLIGVVAGLNEIHTIAGKDCASIEIIMQGNLGGVFTQIIPLLKTIKNT